MGPELEKSKVVNLVEILPHNKGKEKEKESVFREEVGASGAVNGVRNEDVEVDIVDCTKSGLIENVEHVDEDDTESMSSFGGSDSEDENCCEFKRQVRASLVNENDELVVFRKKKLTDHWRRFIRPLMWRCKWIELQIKEFQSQALKYDIELEGHAQRKQFDFDTFFVDGLDTKSHPFSSSYKRKKLVKRKKRKRIENMTDVRSYTLQHNLFSYYENRKPTVHSALINDDCDYPGKAARAHDDFLFQDGWTSHDSRAKENIQENILWKIELLQSQVRKLKVRIENVISENPDRFPSVDMMDMLVSGDALTTSGQNLASPSEDGDKVHARSSQHRSEFGRADLLPDSRISSHDEVVPLPDIIENTGRLLRGISGENIEEGVLINIQAVKQEMQDFDPTGSLQPEKGKELMEGDEPMETFVPRLNFGEKTLPKSRSTVPSNMRTRGRRKSRRGRWTRK